MPLRTRRSTAATSARTARTTATAASRRTARAGQSYQTALVSLLTAGMTDCEVRLEARSASGADTRIQSYMLRLHRVPTLASLAVYGEGTRLPLTFDPAATEYAVTTVSDRLTIEAVPFGTEGYSVTVNGGTSAEVPVGTITVQVAHTNGERTAYTIAATKVDSVEVRITVPAGTDTAVFNAADSEIAPVGSGTYRLIPGESYTWITTKQEFYHASGSFEAAGRSHGAGVGAGHDGPSQRACLLQRAQSEERCEL